MLAKTREACAIMLLGMCSMGCRSEAKQPLDYEYPTKAPICLVEYDPNVTIYRRAELGERFQPLPVEDVLIIPLYRNYRSQRGKRYAGSRPSVSL